jgi:hypothetical protein
MDIDSARIIAMLLDQKLKEMRTEYDEPDSPEIHSLTVTLVRGARVERITLDRQGNVKVESFTIDHHGNVRVES